jgi:prefoldin subunit 5
MIVNTNAREYFKQRICKEIVKVEKKLKKLDEMIKDKTRLEKLKKEYDETEQELRRLGKMLQEECPQEYTCLK